MKFKPGDLVRINYGFSSLGIVLGHFGSGAVLYVKIKTFSEKQQSGGYRNESLKLIYRNSKLICRS